jgi:hypothetical protein
MMPWPAMKDNYRRDRKGVIPQHPVMVLECYPHHAKYPYLAKAERTNYDALIALRETNADEWIFVHSWLNEGK